jgi:predicted PurR-regulated permease PerM
VVGSLKINPLTAIVSLFIGTAVWGLAVMVLFLSIAAMLKVVWEEFEKLKPIALIIGVQL